jgi:multidrug transporter EmrE-like cation transporter
MWWIVFVCAVVLSICGDVAMKQAWRDSVVCVQWACVGFCAYAITSFSWLVLLKGPVANAIGLVVAGYLVFGERISGKNVAGILAGMAAIYLLGETS